MRGDSNPNQAEWFAEFKKLSKNPPAGASKPDVAPPSGKPSDRRNHLRFSIEECQATLYREGILNVFGVNKQNRARAALDLSEGGVRFLTHERLAIGMKVRMIIQMDKYKDQIEASGEVRWCYQSLSKTDDFYVGVQFADLDPAQKRKIVQMKEWFTSPQYRAVRETKRKAKEDEFQFPH
jgi:c-di-GMP-binding flagellar brake protein YcgR